MPRSQLGPGLAGRAGGIGRAAYNERKGPEGPLSKVVST